MRCPTCYKSISAARYRRHEHRCRKTRRVAGRRR